jgi:hypothetical protein
MTKNAISVNGGAMPKIDRKFVMTRAWEIFRRAYRYPHIKFSDIGRKCFAWPPGLVMPELPPRMP